MTMEYTRNGMLLGLKVKGQGHRVNNSILHTRTAIPRHSLGGVTSRRREIELYECLLVYSMLSVAAITAPVRGESAAAWWRTSEPRYGTPTCQKGRNYRR